MSGNGLLRTLGPAILVAVAACADNQTELGEPQTWPTKVVITNDDGFDSRASMALARAFAEVTETYLVVPAENQSSGTNFAEAARSGRFHVEARDVGPGISAYAVDGYPADCVFFALNGLLRESPPDLVISGVNTGNNLADAWILSGTIGAARVAAYYGVPSLAVSGIDDDDVESVEAVANWVVRFAQSEPVRRLVPPQYLTVSLPVGPASQIRGVEVTERARGLRSMTAMRLTEDRLQAGVQAWSFDVVRDAFPAPQYSDAAVVGEGSIAIVAMRVDESDTEMHDWLLRNKGKIPVW
jgi:5'-nucleotidase